MSKSDRSGAGEDHASLRVVVVDGQDLFARSLEMALPEASGGRIEVVGTAGTVEDALVAFTEKQPDVALVDLALPDPGALELVRKVAEDDSRPRLIGVSDGEDVDLASEALSLGMEALVTKAARPEHLLAPVLAVLQGWRVLSAPLLDELLDRAYRPGSEILDEIDDDMLALWLLVAEGLELSRIAERLYVSERTAKRMVADLRNRLGATTRIQMAALAGRAGLLDDWPKGSEAAAPSTNGTKPAAVTSGAPARVGVPVSLDRLAVAKGSRRS
jgi:DNA-binding NarL/FixJ family response regulator